MKVFILLSRISRGGIEMRTLQMLEHFSASADKQFDFYVYLTSGEGGELEERYRRCAKVLYRDKSTSILPDFVKNIRAVGPDIVYVHANLASGVYCVTARLLGFKNIFSHITTAGDYGDSITYKTKKPFYRFLTNRFSKKVIGVCDAAQRLTATPDKKWITLYDGFENRPFIDRKKSDDALRLVMVGRLHPVKNHDYALQVTAKVREKVPVRLEIYGHGDEKYVGALRDKIAAYGLSDVVRLAGVSDEPIDAIAANDVLILPSIREGLPGVVIEALCAGRPVVCADLDGCREISRHSNNVVCLPAEEAFLAQWRDAVIAAGSNADPGAVRSEFLASPFSIDAHCEKLCAIWRSEV